MSYDVAAIAARLAATVAATTPVLRARQEPAVSQPPASGKWSQKQILGHLIDSAANNHQRFVRGQLVERLSDPGYQQQDWVQTQDYQGADWAELVDFWSLYNRRLAHLIGRLPESKLDTPIAIGGSEPVDLGFVAVDYLRHLEHHLGQLQAV
jgi:hypothetical protein